MDDLVTNKEKQHGVPEKFGENAKALEEMAKRIDWRFVRRAYWYTLGAVCLALFCVIASVRLAFYIF